MVALDEIVTFDDLRNRVQQALVAMRLPDISVDAFKARIIWNQFPIDCKANGEIIAKYRAKHVSMETKASLLNELLKCLVCEDFWPSEKECLLCELAIKTIIGQAKMEPDEETPAQISRPGDPSEEQRNVRRRIDATPASAASSSSCAIPSGLRESLNDVAEVKLPAVDEAPSKVKPAIDDRIAIPRPLPKVALVGEAVFQLKFDEFLSLCKSRHTRAEAHIFQQIADMDVEYLPTMYSYFELMKTNQVKILEPTFAPVADDHRDAAAVLRELEAIYFNPLRYRGVPFRNHRRNIVEEVREVARTFIMQVGQFHNEGNPFVGFVNCTKRANWIGSDQPYDLRKNYYNMYSDVHYRKYMLIPNDSEEEEGGVEHTTDLIDRDAIEFEPLRFIDDTSSDDWIFKCDPIFRDFIDTNPFFIRYSAFYWMMTSLLPWIEDYESGGFTNNGVFLLGLQEVVEVGGHPSAPL